MVSLNKYAIINNCRVGQRKVESNYTVQQDFVSETNICVPSRILPAEFDSGSRIASNGPNFEIHPFEIIV